MHATRGNIIRGIRATWYVMDGADIVSKHETPAAAEAACEVLRDELRIAQKAEERKNRGKGRG